MATKIFDIELAAAGDDHADIAGYDHALFLLRASGRPVGQATVPVRDGRISGRELLRAIDHGVFDRAAIHRAVQGLDPGRPVALTVTAAICTRERPDDLERALKALVPAAGDRPVIVIDNCPATDRTREIVGRFPSVRYVVEPRKGLDNARNRALAEATTDIVAFIDDDAVADSRWLTEIMRPFADPAVGCVTGLTMPFELENAAQEDFERLAGFSKRGFNRRVFRMPGTHPLATGAIGAGANMAVRRSVVTRIGPFDPALDAGTATQSGGDHEFFTRVLRAGLAIVYEPAALNWHRHRRTPDELLKAVYGYGVGVYAGWTRALIVDGEWGVLRRAAGWLFHEQIPNLVRTFVRPVAEPPRAVVWAELKGCLRGPFAYLSARRTAREDRHD